jgi:uncharacterized protein with FMN-binding domain
MKRPALIVSGTLVGFVGLLGYRAMSPSGLTFVVAPSATSATTLPHSVTPTTSAPPPQHSTTTSTPPSHTTTTQGRATSPTTTVPRVTTTTAPSASHSATGDSVNYIYGVLSVTVTTSGSKISNVTIGSLNDGGNYLSQSIDQSAIPQLEQQALSAQSSNIQGVSGASYTSAGFKQSLQSALSKLGL